MDLGMNPNLALYVSKSHPDDLAGNSKFVSDLMSSSWMEIPATEKHIVTVEDKEVEVMSVSVEDLTKEYRRKKPNYRR